MIHTEQLSKRYGDVDAVANVSFRAEPGRVTGFLGPNGAGKSTTLRMIVGLTQPTSGRATIDGRRFADMPNPGREVGVLLDASAQHVGRTGREILTLASQTMGLERRRVAEALDLVGLSEKESRRMVRHYSLGMRQRLGLAAAIIGQPRTLILDEPANGLDPAGIRWMRDLLRSYADDGMTVLLSSHLLAEIEVIADDIVVIGHGRIVANGTKQDLLASSGTLVRSHQIDALHDALVAENLVTKPASQAAGSWGVIPGLHVDASPEQVGALAFSAGIPLSELRPNDGAGLEDMFLELTADTSRDNININGVAA
ncbi:MAG: ATP-binding cassette domain-containing protein [Acidimicrobiales bacterium]